MLVLCLMTYDAEIVSDAGSLFVRTLWHCEKSDSLVMLLLEEGYDLVAGAAAACDSDVGSSLFVVLALAACFHCTLCVMHSVMLMTLQQGSLMVCRDVDLVMAMVQDVTPKYLWFSGRWSW